VRSAVTAIEERGRRALLVGGTGLYFRAVVDPLEFPPEDRAVRAALEAEADTPGGAERLHEEIAAVDPAAAARIEPGNLRRTVRALEVVRITGRPFSSFGPGLLEYGETVFPLDAVALRVPRPVLDARITARLGHMRAAGLVDEVRRLAARPGGLSRTAAQAIGYKEVLAHLAGEVGEDEAFAEIDRRTRRFARRQMGWFERDPRIRWVDAENAHDAAALLVESWDPCRASA
jgi:tRNA dimethylallyltransferase